MASRRVWVKTPAAGAAVVLAMVACASACSRAAPPVPPATAQTGQSKSVPTTPTKEQSDSKNSAPTPPTPEEMAPMRPEYLAELAKIHEPPEMAGRPMQVRKPVPANALRLQQVMDILRSPDKATHAQRTTAINELIELATNIKPTDGIDTQTIYGAVATMACIDGVNPQTVIEYANRAIGGESDDALALRARMYLRESNLGKALTDLEKIMVDDEGRSLVGGDADPHKESLPCGWGIADIDSLGSDPRALATKGLYLSSFIPYNAEAKGTVKEPDIRDLYARSAASWHSPIPHYLSVTLEGFGSDHSMNGAKCIRPIVDRDTEGKRFCAKYDDDIRKTIRELTMALVIDPTFAPALSKRASDFLDLAQTSYADKKPSRNLFELAIKDYSAALAAGGRNKHTLYCDQAIALASIGRYQDAAASYMEGMRQAKDGVEGSPFVYQQLAGVYTRLGRFQDAADVLTQAIMNTSGSGITHVIFFGGMKGFRALYPEYDLLPDQILAEAVRRRFEPQFPQSWDADFASKEGLSKGKIPSTILPDLYVKRGDAYLSAGRREAALADYRRVKSDAWDGQEQFLPRHMYFTEHGGRVPDSPEQWPQPPPKL